MIPSVAVFQPVYVSVNCQALFSSLAGVVGAPKFKGVFAFSGVRYKSGLYGCLKSNLVTGEKPDNLQNVCRMNET